MLTLLMALVPVGWDDAPTPPIPLPPREFRGVWVASVANIDWPSRKGLSTTDQQAELRRILDKCVELGLNAVVLQVRPMCDALYASELEPWSEFLTGKLGKAPEPYYDPLTFAVQESHRRGLELHAWFNPYRAKAPQCTGPVPPEHIVKKRPDLAKQYGKYYWLDPGEPDVKQHSLDVIRDVVLRYDVDGVHLDDYFYPYKERGADGKELPFPDDPSWERYRKGGGKLSRDDWRRSNVDDFVQRLYKMVKAEKRWVKVGISPFGIWRPGNPPGIEGFDQYAGLYADARKWLREGWVDYFTPQLYWPSSRPKQSYPRLLAWWAGENVHQRHLWPGLIPSRVGSGPDWPATEITKQITDTRKQQGAGGNIHFSMKALVRNSGGVSNQLAELYRDRALPPAMPWLTSGPAAPPIVRRENGRLTWETPRNNPARLVLAATRAGEKWQVNILPAEPGRWPEGKPVPSEIYLAAVDRVGQVSAWVRAVGESKKVSVLLIDGQNNHDWRATTPFLKQALEKSGRFTVAVSSYLKPGDRPGTIKQTVPFPPSLDLYDVVLSNYNGEPWPTTFQRALEDRLRRGKIGLVIVHAANNAFPAWHEYNLMIGMGWRGPHGGERWMLDPQDRPVRMPSGKGDGSGHRYTGPFTVTVRDADHPITRGMPREWLHARDELYDNLRGPIQNVHILATAFSKGTSAHEPMIWTVAYGQGRVFHTPMGHDLTGMRCAGFVTTVGRGTEWAATGNVTLPIPAEFPTGVTSAQARATADIREWMRRETRRLADAALADVKTADDWQRRRPVLRRQLADMLGLSPLPPRTDLKATVTGTVDGGEFVVEKLHFQSMPGLYVTANFYRPKKVDHPLPTILYVCGHGNNKVNGISYGSKTVYQHHAAWFARNGYCCLIPDTLQLGEIEGFHHGTYRMGLWWWQARGYTPAGVEAWNAMRALDYLETRPEVDAKRIGMTGRSGGGAYTWWTAALDDRVACLVPVAGITDLENHVVDDCIEGHCDCMFMVNSYGWDFATVAALAAPRPLLFSNTDKDTIFPLDGVVRTHAKVKRIYKLLGAENKLGLLITEGPHKDTQDLQVPAFRWFARWLEGKDEPVTRVADKPFDPTQLKVFATLPADERNTKIHETFVPKAVVPPAPKDRSAWDNLREGWLAALKEQCFRQWPASSEPTNVKVLAVKEHDGLRLEVIEFTSEGNLRLPVYVLRGVKHARASLTVLTVLDTAGWQKWSAEMQPAFGSELFGNAVPAVDPKALADTKNMLTKFDWIMAYLPPRGEGPNQWNPDAKADTQLRRRFVLLGRTADDGKVWDTRRAVAALRTLPLLEQSRVWLQGEGQMAAIALYAGLFEPAVERFDLHRLPASHRDGPIFLHVLRVLDLPQAIALAYPRKVILYDVNASDWNWPESVARLFDAAKPPLQFRQTVRR